MYRGWQASRLHICLVSLYKVPCDFNVPWNEQAADLRISFIAQEFSWGRLQISETAFCALLQTFGVFDEFISVVRSHGLKINEGERVWYGLRSYRSKIVDSDHASKYGGYRILA